MGRPGGSEYVTRSDRLQREEPARRRHAEGAVGALDQSKLKPSPNTPGCCLLVRAQQARLRRRRRGWLCRPSNSRGAPARRPGRHSGGRWSSGSRCASEGGDMLRRLIAIKPCGLMQPREGELWPVGLGGQCAALAGQAAAAAAVLRRTGGCRHSGQRVCLFTQAHRPQLTFTWLH